MAQKKVANVKVSEQREGKNFLCSHLTDSATLQSAEFHSLFIPCEMEEQY